MTIVGSSVNKLVAKKSTQNKVSKDLDKDKEKANPVEIAEDQNENNKS